MTDLSHKPTLPNDTVRNTVWIAVAMLLTMVALKMLGRIVWCECGGWSPWSWDIWSSHNSQHLIDPYFFSHVLHGFIFYAVLYFCWKSGSMVHRFRAAVLIEAAWELLENSPLIINRYREVTLAQDYFGDSIANSMFDILACSLGFLLAHRLKPVHSVAILVLTELIMTLAIRDCLLLNILMLLCPIDAVRQWQSVH